jgi:ATP synthase protein I
VACSDENNVDQWKQGIKLIGVGFYICACIVGGALGGMWLDGKFNTQPILILIGLVLGLIIAFWGVYQMLIPMIKESTHKKDRR